MLVNEVDRQLGYQWHTYLLDCKQWRNYRGHNSRTCDGALEFHHCLGGGAAGLLVAGL